MFDKLIKRLLISRIKYPEVPKTKGDILKYALYIYLNGEHNGLCHSIRAATEYYDYKCDIINNDIYKIPQVFPLFERRIAVCFFNGHYNTFWWPVKDWRNRYRFMKWLIKKYNNVEL